MEMTSPAFEGDGTIPDRYGHRSPAISPPLRWSDVPSDCSELALTCIDPDAPGGPFVHWLLGGIQPDRDGLDEGEAPAGTVAGRNDCGTLGYCGPQPPEGHGPHRYVFELHALAEPIELEDTSDVVAFQEAIDRSLLASARLVGWYGA